MDECNALRKIVFDAGRLRQVQESRFESATGFVTAVTLVFEELKAHFIAMPDDDTIRINLDTWPNDPGCVLTNATDRHPWLPVRGCNCIAAWLLTNEQGYSDGVRFEFRTKSASYVVEMVVAASSFQYYGFPEEA